MATSYACGHCGSIAVDNYHTVDDLCGRFHCATCATGCRFDLRDDMSPDVDLLDWLDAPGYAEDR